MEIPMKEWTVWPTEDVPTEKWPRFATEPEAKAYADAHGGLVLGIADVEVID
jgi:hypothetical protein